MTSALRTPILRFCRCYSHTTGSDSVAVPSLVVNSFKQVSTWIRQSKKQSVNGREVIGTLHLDRSKDVECDNLMCDGSVVLPLYICTCADGILLFVPLVMAM